MPAEKFIKIEGNESVERPGAQSSAGAADAGRIVALDESGRISTTMMPTGFGADATDMQASENIAGGDLVNIHDVAGAFRIRKADASVAGKEAHGFAPNAIAAGASGTVHFEGMNTALTGLAPGVQFLSATIPGKTTSTAPSATGQVLQRVGFAVSATALNFEPHQPIVRA